MPDKKCHIYIYGDIVNIQAKNLQAQGAVSLTTVKTAYDANSDCDEIIVHIHSNGGSVHEGFAIHDFLVNTGKKVTTVVEGLCCSIATVIFMAGSERKLTENSRFLIHNPWGGAEGNAAEFRKYANELEGEQKRILNFYKQQTGASTKVLQAYMNEEKLMEPSLALELKFSTAIIDTVKAMAMYRDKSHNQFINNKNNMDKNKKEVSGFMKLVNGLKALAESFAEGAKAAVKKLADEAGDVYFDGELAEGTAVFEDDAMTTPCADGDYQFDDGTEITVVGGLVTEVLEDTDEQQTNDSKTIEDLKNQLAALTAEKLELENSMKESEAVLTQASKALSLAKSTYRPEKRESKFNRIENKKEDGIVDKMAARREELKAKRKK
jgi:ATP-dependent Clp endopeptidase proteolytic subunit ClpP